MSESETIEVLHNCKTLANQLAVTGLVNYSFSDGDKALLQTFEQIIAMTPSDARLERRCKIAGLQTEDNIWLINALAVCKARSEEKISLLTHNFEQSGVFGDIF